MVDIGDKEPHCGSCGTPHVPRGDEYCDEINQQLFDRWHAVDRPPNVQSCVELAAIALIGALMAVCILSLIASGLVQ